MHPEDRIVRLIDPENAFRPDDLVPDSHTDPVGAVPVGHGAAETEIPSAHLTGEIGQLVVHVAGVAAVQLIGGDGVSLDLLHHGGDHRDAVIDLFRERSHIVLHDTDRLFLFGVGSLFHATRGQKGQAGEE